MEFTDTFKYDPAYLERTRETTTNPFWLDVMNGLQMLQSSNYFKRQGSCNNTPLWYNNNSQLKINFQRHDRSNLIIGDL